MKLQRTAILSFILVILLSACGVGIPDSLLNRSSLRSNQDQTLKVFFSMSGGGSSKVETNTYLTTGNYTGDLISETRYIRDALNQAESLHLYDSSGRPVLGSNMAKSAFTFGITQQWKSKITRLSVGKETLVLINLDQEINPWNLEEGVPSYKASILERCKKDGLRLANCKLEGINVVLYQFTKRVLFFDNARLEFDIRGDVLSDLPLETWFDDNAQTLDVMEKLTDIAARVEKAFDGGGLTYSEISNLQGDLLETYQAELYRLVTDPDQYNLLRVSLNRLPDYVSCAKPVESWVCHAVTSDYDMKWNNLRDHLKAVYDFTIDDLFKGDGTLKVSISDGRLSLLAKSGWPNTGHPDLSSISLYRFDPEENKWDFVIKMQVRAFVGSQYALVFFQRSDKQLDVSKVAPFTMEIPTCIDDNAKCDYEADDQDYWTELQAEEAVRDFILHAKNEAIESPILMSLEDNSEYVCDGSGDSCTYRCTRREFSASYYVDPESIDVLVDFLGVLGKVGANNLGFGFVYAPQTGNGLGPMAGNVLASVNRNPYNLFLLDMAGVGTFPYYLQNNQFLK